MKKITSLFSLLFLSIITQVSAQEKVMKELTTIKIVIVESGKVEMTRGYLVGFDMKNLKTPYTAVVFEKKNIENAKQAILYFPMKNGKKSEYHVENISNYLFTDKSNNLAIIKFGELRDDIENKIIVDDVLFVPEDMITNFSFPLDSVKLKELKESWEKSMMTN